MKHTIPYGNWAIALADTVEVAKDGDIIEVHTESMKILAEIARRRLCPEKRIEFIIKGDDQ